MKNWEKKIIKRIKKGEIKEEPKWLYLIKKFFLWLSFLSTTILSTITFTYFLRDITNTFGKMHEFKIQSSFFLNNLFWIWGLSFIIFILISFWAFKKTKNGFKYESYKIIIFSLVISVFFGSTLYFFQINKKEKNNLYKIHYFLKNNKEIISD